MVCLLVIVFPVAAQDLRSFDDIFPGLREDWKTEAFSENGFICSYSKNQSLELIPSLSSGINIQNDVLKIKPAYLAESLHILPYSGTVLTKLDAYNALGKIRGLKGRTYRSYTKNAEVPLFEDATRLQTGKTNSVPIPDPPPAKELPLSDTVYIRLKDTNFGQSFYRSQLSASPYGVTFSLSNFKSLTYLFFTVMKEEKFSAILYLEPLTEGMLIYSVTGADASDFVASKVHIPSAIEKRLAVFMDWVKDGLL